MTQPISVYVTCNEPDWGTTQTYAHGVVDCAPGATVIRAYASTDEGNFGSAMSAVSVTGVDAIGITYVIGGDATGADTLRRLLIQRFKKLPTSYTFEVELHTARAASAEKTPDPRPEADVLEDTTELSVQAGAKVEALPPQKRVRRGH